MKKKVLFIIPPERFNEEELNIPKNVLTDNGIEVVVSSTRIGEITGDYEGIAISTNIFSDLNINDFDIISVIGGSGTIDYLWENKSLIKYLNEAHKKNILISGICAGAVSIAETNLLANRSATCYPVDIMINKLIKHHANYLDKNVVVHEDIITSNGPDGAKDFGLALLNLYL
ncbi:DJ-1/PfpI family protein [Cetobacterium somerae]|uniref:DJ-1/PfpI family protein n=1 Tax=Cetobacterium sp. NK01 TaxID=2993530 RepID=UPI00211720CE|nr:DJ-1/PfpI family protein [Cetobacterium sp. NK01]MCQ8211152.1 DJ-1/PfpI family protein [Cetobacterium sp. NK01]